MKAVVLPAVLALLPLPSMAGGFECRLTRECRAESCEDMLYTPYIDMNWGRIVLRGMPTEITLERRGDDPAPDRWELVADLPANGLLRIEIDTSDNSAVFTTFSRRGDEPRVVTVTGTCEARG
ncbi:MAG TPA: hypothetical protein ENJ52_05440 [Aliiroseovarius sp.]|nr:hypothetical protein [Aliiroseovarius sp.]